MSTAFCVKLLAWSEIRAFLIKRPFLNGTVVDNELFALIVNMQTENVSIETKCSLSLWIAGYLTAKKR